MKITFLNCLGWIMLVMIVGWSCQKENETGPTPGQSPAQAEMTARDNSQMVSISQDVMEVTSCALAGQGIMDGSTSSFGRTQGSEMNCAPSITGSFSIDRNHPDTVIFSGKLVIDYGTGASCRDTTDVRKGKIIDSFVFLKTLKGIPLYNLTETVTFQNFQKDTIQLDGTFIGKSSSRAVATLEIQNAKITYLDGTSANWNGMISSTFIRRNYELDKYDYSRELTGSIQGTSRSGAAFSASIVKGVLFRYSCSRHIPVSGTINLKAGGVTSVLDFGTGICDKFYSVTTGGNTTVYTFNGHHKITSSGQW